MVVGVDCWLQRVVVSTSSVGRGMAAEASSSHGLLSPVTSVGLPGVVVGMDFSLQRAVVSMASVGQQQVTE
jgi:hypothetical protein